MAEVQATVWWDSLKHGGLLISPAYLARYFGEDPGKLSPFTAEKLRRQLTRFESDGNAALVDLLDVVLESICGLDSTNGTWVKGADVDSSWTRRAITGEAVKPRRLWRSPSGEVFPIFVAEDPRLGVGKGARPVSRVLEWLRKGDQKIALLTNGNQWRLVYAGIDFDAWAEWETELWFQEGLPGPQADALRMLLSPRALRTTDGVPPVLLTAIDESRKGQADLSSELGERVRKAVERLIQSHAPALDAAGGSIDSKEIYLAAVRIVMRMVVILFAEARRDLLPLDNPVYFDTYGLQGLRHNLRRSSGGGRVERLRHQFGSWPRVLGLFQLIHAGSPHQMLEIPRYGGELFRPGDANAEDGISRAVHIFETACFKHEISDAVVLELIENITTTHVRVRQGKQTTRIPVPVNFADLSSEYIGMLYEGLLGYELRKAPDDDAIIILALGDQPALPLNRLEQMDDKALENLVEKVKKKSKGPALSEDDDSEDEEDEEPEPEEAGEDTPEEDDDAAGDEQESEENDAVAEASEKREEIRERARAWSIRAVRAGKLVKRPRSTRSDAVEKYESEVGKTAATLSRAQYLPGEYYLVRASGTRKGSGTFYTRPSLAVPTTHRTLRPLVYEPPLDTSGDPDELAPSSLWTPRKPEEILAVKVCDPACGSASFLVAALKFLTDALYESLHHHGRIRANGETSLVALAEGKEGSGALSDETLPLPPEHPQFEPRLKARLKRYVVERCIYGVDFDMLAVELARLALWIETMDRDLPFEFLDHKIKVGNSLVGCWFDSFRGYPILAWEREGGDKGREKFVHHFRVKKKGFGKESRGGDLWTERIKESYKNRVIPAMKKWVSGQTSFLDEVTPEAARAQHDEALNLFNQLHAMPIQQSEERASFYRGKMLGSDSYLEMRAAFDTWCALWFWPPDALAEAPLPGSLALSDQGREIVKSLGRKIRFFHWELEFPDVFVAAGSGFHAIIGNPPWEISKPNSKEFFSRIDPLYRSYGKQEAIGQQLEYFNRSAEDERSWVEYGYGFKAMANWVRNAASPFGDGADGGTGVSFSRSPKGKSEDYKKIAKLRAGVRGYADPHHPFRHQGSADLNLYKMLLEQSHALLRNGGRLGMLVPSGIYTDKGTAELRRLFLDRCRWRWLFGLENSRKIFDIHRSYKFNPIIIEKGGSTESIMTSFMRREVRDWEEAERHAISYTRDQIERFSPRSLAILEIRDPLDLEVLGKIYSSSILLGDQSEDGWKATYAREFDMTNDSKLFPPRTKWEAQGYEPDQYGRWLGPNGEIALPLYEGRMVGQFDFSQKGWVSGKGRTAKWREIAFDAKTIEPQYLMLSEDAAGRQPIASDELKVVFMDIASATNERTMYATVLPRFPAGHSAPILSLSGRSVVDTLALTAILNSFTFDYLLRKRVGGLHLTWHYLEETPIARPSPSVRAELAIICARLAMPSQVFDAQWRKLRTLVPEHPIWSRELHDLWAIANSERTRLRASMDAAVAFLFGLRVKDLHHLLKGCDRPSEELRRPAHFDPKGFWRVDKEKPPHLRHTVLSLAALQELERSGSVVDDQVLVDFLRGPDGLGWQTPDTLSLKSLGFEGTTVKEQAPVQHELVLISPVTSEPEQGATLDGDKC